MTALSACNNSNIFYKDPGALQIGNQFCSCPAARSLLSSFGDKISIDVRTGSYPQIRFAFKESAPGESANEIQIPERMLKLKDTVANFGLEIFNVKNRNELEGLWDRAQKGDVDMDEYAKEYETIEFKSRDEAIDLALTCQFLEQSSMKDITRDLEIHLWNKEFDCHTDKIRQRWLESHKDAYCGKNPKKKSCKMKPKDLCEYYQVTKMPEREKYLFRVNRICENLPNLPQKVKDWYPSEVKFCRLRDEF